jgi:transcriptional regulator with XRE-family HTH domain
VPRKNQIAHQLGSRMRDLRRRKKITLLLLGDLTGIAQATLSRMETGLMVGTVKNHQKIAECLGISLAELYEGMDSRHAKVRFQTADTPRKISAKTDQMKCELLTQEVTKKKITPLLITLNRYGKSGREQLERGVEKFLMVLEGIVMVKIDASEYVLNPFDSLYFDATMSHQLFNHGTKQAKLICAVSPSKI